MDELGIIAIADFEYQLSGISTYSYMNESRQEKLNQVLGKLLDSYREYSEIELIGSVGLPAKDSIIKLVDDLSLIHI